MFSLCSVLILYIGLLATFQAIDSERHPIIQNYYSQTLGVAIICPSKWEEPTIGDHDFIYAHWKWLTYNQAQWEELTTAEKQFIV